MARHNKKYIDRSILDKARYIKAKIFSVIEAIEYSDGKIKTVFDCESSSGIPRRCVYWGRTDLTTGDEVILKGRFKNDIFIVWSITISKKQNKEEIQK